MSDRANVSSIVALEELRGAVAVFTEEAERALMSADAEIARSLRRLGHDLPARWKSELRKREEAVVKARIALEQALASRQMGKSTVEERKALARAKERVAAARARIEATARWRRQLEREELIYRGRVEPLRSFIQAGAPRAAESLRRMVDRLDEYVSIAAPADEPDEGATRADRPGAAPGPASSMSRGAPAPTPHDDHARILQRLPSPSDVEAAGEGTTDDLPAPPLAPGERAAVAGLPQHPAGAGDPRGFVLVANTARGAGRVAFHRATPCVEGDSGWRVLGLDAREPSRWRRVPILRILRAKSPAYDLLRLAEGWTIVAAPAAGTAVERVLDPGGAPHWSSMREDRESST